LKRLLLLNELGAERIDACFVRWPTEELLLRRATGLGDRRRLAPRMVGGFALDSVHQILSAVRP
jgi:hypothetical protein